MTTAYHHHHPPSLNSQLLIFISTVKFGGCLRTPNNQKLVVQSVYICACNYIAAVARNHGFLFDFMQVQHNFWLTVYTMSALSLARCFLSIKICLKYLGRFSSERKNYARKARELQTSWDSRLSNYGNFLYIFII